MQARHAILPDAISIEQLIQVHVADGTLLPRNLAEICENIRDFVVVEHSSEIVGCGALHLYGMHLAEIRSITVTAKAAGRGAGRMLVDALLLEAKRQSVTCICLFTRIPDFFGQMGFLVVDKKALPDKMHKDCLKCPRLHACDETAMFLGTLPKHAPAPVSARSAPPIRANCATPARLIGRHNSILIQADRLP
jgi:amino-acid N-acetyltransferase